LNKKLEIKLLPKRAILTDSQCSNLILWMLHFQQRIKDAEQVPNIFLRVIPDIG
jgi:hypothetical protein